ncbi:alpha/beta fold hydrolase [Sneathiella aquimaris]|uniref:alpha/beta fold hydrolase n=1 Tax=Sneathiella aquimaris TaxID=2599305 RepID=UPI00146CE5C0|nr:alpha/beta hydrolase [Sneathiella aquimaris]
MSDKHPLILIPGLLCTDELWRDQIQALSDISDVSIPKHHLDDDISLIADRILKDAPEKFALAGLSMGGYIALEIVLQAPDRVTHLALVDTRADADSPQDRKRREDFIRLVQRGKTFKGVTESLLPMLIHPSRFQDDALTSRIYQMAEDIGQEGFIRQETAIMNRKDRNAELGKIVCPTIVISGNEDALISPDLQEKMANAIPDAEFHLIAECGHLPSMERPFEVNTLFREWLSWTS